MGRYQVIGFGHLTSKRPERKGSVKMKKAIPGIIAAAALGLSTLGCDLDCPEGILVDNPSVGVTGDSIQSGGGCLCGGTDLYLGHALMKRGIADYGVANFAAGGSTITGGIPPQYDHLKADYPNVDIVLVDGGVNDVESAEQNGTLEQSIPVIEQAMLDYLTTINNDGKKAVVYTIPYLIAPTPRMTQENMDHVNVAIYELNAAFTIQALSFEFPVFALDAMMDENPEAYYADWIHPSCAAYGEIGERVAIMIEYLLS